MSRSGLPSHNSPAYGKVVPFRSRIPLCGWGMIDGSADAHYLENSRTRCAPLSQVAHPRLIASLKGRTPCVVCAELSAALKQIEDVGAQLRAIRGAARRAGVLR